VKLAIFDIDGTLVDSRQLIHEAMMHAFDRTGLPDPGYDRIRHVIGLGLRQAFETLEPEAPTDVIAALEAAYVEAFVILRATPVGREHMYDGALDLLTHLRATGWRLSVATGKSHRGVAHIYNRHNLAPMFECYRCAEDGPGKPDPFMIASSLSHLDVPADRAVMIGDAVHDMRMARSAGVRALGVTWGFGTADEIRDAGAHEVHHDFATLRASLDVFAAE
jgi:phosphoglycolate phosphatase